MSYSNQEYYAMYIAFGGSPGLLNTTGVIQMVHDPIGPGTPAWQAFDAAMEAWRQWHEQPNERLYRRFRNQRQYMIQLLKKNGSSPKEIRQWCDSLTEQRKESE